jgi:GNAT superfamily N-acetyltransferase
MCDEWMTALQLPLTTEQFRRLPRNAAYRYVWFDGTAWINPRPRYYHALLDLREPMPAPQSSTMPLRPVGSDDWEALERLFAAAFEHQPPFNGLDDETRRRAAGRSLRQTRVGGDGPWVEAASFLAPAGSDRPVGAVLVTLLPDRDATDWDSYHWSEPPPPDCIARRLGRPHLTWIFVDPSAAGRGVGTTLLRAAATALRGLGYTELASTFLAGNDSSILWHWRSGFRLLAHPGSRRRKEG